MIRNVQQQIKLTFKWKYNLTYNICCSHIGYRYLITRNSEKEQNIKYNYYM